jgi:Flp pilus assembly protein TadD
MRLPISFLLVAAICWTMASGLSLAVDSERSSDVVDLTSIRQKIKAKNWHAAIEELKPIVACVNNADAFNLYAFSLRNTGDHRSAFTYYGKALDFDPNHKGAREYLGELYVITGDMIKAGQQLTMLEKLCPSGCEELDDLRKAIAAGPPKTN